MIKWTNEHLGEIWKLLDNLGVRRDDKGEIILKLVSLGHSMSAARSLLLALENFQACSLGLP